MTYQQGELDISRTNERVVRLGSIIRDESTSTPEFIHTVLCQVGLPRRQITADHFERTNGKASLLVSAGRMFVNGKWEKQVVPYGTKPRLILFHISTEAVKKSSPVIAVGKTVSDFMNRLQINTNGRARHAFRKQMNALCACQMQLGYGLKNLNAKPVDQYDAWADHHEDLNKESVIELSPRFYEELKNNAVPLDPRALEALQHSALALDIYTWLAHRLYRVRDGGERLHWASLRAQFGQEYSDDKNFKRTFLTALRQVSVVYPDARIEQANRGLKLLTSPPPVPQKTVVFFKNHAAGK